MDDTSRGEVDATLRWFENELNPASAIHTTVPAHSPTARGNLPWADHYMFGEISFSAQRILLFLRAIIKHPDIVVLDEAFSGMDDTVRDKCMLFLAHGEERPYPSTAGPNQTGPDRAVTSSTGKVTGLADNQALVCISHIKEEVPDCVREWLCLPEANTGQPARFGRFSGPLRKDRKQWDEIWNTTQLLE
jgi:hypothetical protein